MGQSKYLIDSNAIVDYLGNKLPKPGIQFVNEIIDARPQLSIITKIEILGFKAPLDSQNLLIEFINDSIVFELSDDIVAKTISLRKIHKIKIPDAIIAATSLVHNLLLLTRNVNDFKMITGLELVNPWDI